MTDLNGKTAQRAKDVVAEIEGEGGSATYLLTTLSDLRTGRHGSVRGASRAALELLTKAWAVEYGGRGVRVNAVALARHAPE